MDGARGTVKPMGIFVLGVFCTVIAPWASAAQNAVTPDAADTPCAPACEADFECAANGVCHKPCDPTCPDGEECTQRGRCIPSSSTPAAVITTTVASPAANQPATAWYQQPYQQFPQHSATGYGNYENDGVDSALFEEGRRKKSAGVALMVPGILGIVGAAALGFVSGLTGEGELLLVGIGIEAVSVALFIPGVVLTAKGSAKMRRARRQLAALSLEGVGPLLGSSAHTNPVGMTAVFSF